MVGPPIRESSFDFPRVHHYYGDAVRGLFLGATALMLIGAPLYAGDDLMAYIPFIVVGIVVVVALAALTNPFKIWVIMADSIAAGAGATIYGIWALLDYQDSTLLAFALRGAIALAFLFAFYFSLKTMRAMMLHQVGHRDRESDFRDNDTIELSPDSFVEEDLTPEEIDRRANQERVAEDS